MFDQLLEVLLGTDQNKVYVTGWWLTPNDRKIEAFGDKEHWMVVQEHPEYFGLNPEDYIFKTNKTHKFTSMAIENGSIRIVGTPKAYFIDSKQIDKQTLDRVWLSFPDLDKKDLIWDCRVPFKGKTSFRGAIKDLETLIESIKQGESKNESIF